MSTSRLVIPSLAFNSRVVIAPEAFDQQIEKLYSDGTRNHLFIAVNSEKVVQAKHSSMLRNGLENSAGNFVDGIGVVIACSWLHKVKVKRTWGFDMILKFLSRHHGLVFLFGSSESVNARAVAQIETKYPGIQIVGRRHGCDVDNEELRKSISTLKPDLLVVALGSPKQEEWIWEHGRFTDARFVIGVGGALDAIVGDAPRAPKFFQRIGLEWLYRLFRQPGRARRQVALIQFASAVMKDRFRA